MMPVKKLQPKFVDRIPKALQEGVIYVSQKYSTAAHNCCCGCGVKIVTPLKPGKWSIEVHGDKISICPSIGNWSSACQSHYWITGNEVEWARSYTPEEIAFNRRSDKRAREEAHAERERQERTLWGRLWEKVKSWFRPSKP